MKSLCFETLKEFQKINHFPGTFQIGRKDRLWKNLYRFMTKFGKKEYVKNFEFALVACPGTALCCLL
jgi:hypothetical protein